MNTFIFRIQDTTFLRERSMGHAMHCIMVWYPAGWTVNEVVLCFGPGA